MWDDFRIKERRGEYLANGGGFSWKRALGVTKVKRKISRVTGIPLTKSGRQRKIGKLVTCGGCVLPILLIGLCVVSIG